MPEIITKSNMDLEELMDACGEGFTLKKLGKSMWQACSDETCFLSGEGRTAREAVENLLLVPFPKADIIS